jgi:hypothetical protein
MDVFVFATSVEKPRQVSRVKHLLAAVRSINDWNFDLEDCDNILRVEAKGVSPRYIESLLKRAGFEGRELD